MDRYREVNRKALFAMSLRRQGMTAAQIALYLQTSERNIYKLFARARKLYALLVDAGDSKTLIGENLNAFEEMERLALKQFAKVNPNSNVAVGYLNIALSAREKIKKLQQESGLMEKVPETLNVTGLPLENPEVMKAALGLVKAFNEVGQPSTIH